MLEIKNISKSFRRSDGTVKALDGISLEIKEGEFFAVQGKSGSGKTTLLLIAGTILAPDSGEILFNGKKLYSLPLNERTAFRAEKIGFVFQQFHLVPYLTVYENIMLPSLVLKTTDLRKHAMELVENFGLAHRITHLPSELSIGERQRTAMARAMIHSPDILLADEPTGNLDSENAGIILSAMRKFAGQGKHILMVTHSNEATQKADKALHIRND